MSTPASHELLLSSVGMSVLSFTAIRNLLLPEQGRMWECCPSWR